MTILPVGLRRSGTSLLAEILDCLGVFMGSNFCPMPEEWNQNGGFEDADFVDAISDWMHDKSVKDGFVIDGNSSRIQSLIEQRNREHERWGCKNFGLLYVLPHFASLCNASLIRIDRQFASAVSSFAVRSGRTLDDAITWQAHALFNLDMCWERINAPKMRLSYEELLTDPESNIRRIAEFCGTDFQQRALDIVQAKFKRF